MKRTTWLAGLAALLASACMSTLERAAPRAELRPDVVPPGRHVAVVLYGSPTFDVGSLRRTDAIVLRSATHSVRYDPDRIGGLSGEERQALWEWVATDAIPPRPRPIPPPPPDWDWLLRLDVDGDGRRDAVLLFPAADVIRLTPRGQGQWVTLDVAGTHAFEVLVGSVAAAAGTDTIYVKPPPIPPPPPDAE